MLPFRLFFVWLALVLPALSACVGDDSDAPAQHTAALRAAVARPTPGSALPAAPQRRALNVPGRDASPLTPAALFNWAEQAFAGHFPGPQLTQTLAPYTYRFYPATGNYLAVAEGSVYVLGAFTQNEVRRVGLLEDFHCDALPTDCVPPALTLSPATLSATWLYGNPSALTVDATATDASAFTGDLYLYIVDSQGVLQNHVSLSAQGTGRYRAGIAGIHNLPVGHHQGTFLVQLCRDADCQQEYAGSPVRLPYDFHVVAQRLMVSIVGGYYERTVNLGGADSGIDFDLSGSPGAWAASSDVPWLRLNTASGVGPGRINATLETRSLPLGSYFGQLTVLSADGQSQTVGIPLKVMAADTFSAGPLPLAFHAVNGNAVPPANLIVGPNTLRNVPWTLRSTAPWLGLSASGGTGMQVVELRPVATGLASGTHRAELLLAAPGVADLALPVTLTLTRASLTASLPGATQPMAVPTLSFGGSTGRDATPQSLVLKLDTGSNAWPWTVRQLPPWLKASATQGQADEAGTTISFTPNFAGLAAGTVTGQAVVVAQVNGDEVTLPLNLSLKADAPRLLPSQWGVALSSTPTGAVLSRALRVDDLPGGGQTWLAKSSASWLKVTASGRTGVAGALQLSADPTSLPTGATSYATVTITSTTPGVLPTEVKVGLWKGSTGAAPLTRLEAAPADSFPFASVAADPIRPYFYVNEAVEGQQARIVIVHAYSGSKIGSIAVPGARIIRMAVSPDGARLYGLDVFSKTMFVVDLVAGRLSTSWTLGPVDANIWADLGKMHVLRPSGNELLVLDTGETYLGDGKTQGRTELIGALAFTADGRQAFVGSRVGNSYRHYGLDVDMAAGGKLVLTPRTSTERLPNLPMPFDLAVNAEGTRLYVADTTRAGCSWADLPSLDFRQATASAGASGSLVSITADGRVLCGMGLGYYSEDPKLPDLTLHSPTGTLLRSLRVAPAASFDPAKILALVPAGDGMTVAVLLSNRELVLVASPP